MVLAVGRSSMLKKPDVALRASCSGDSKARAAEDAPWYRPWR
jgi:hypothetical protein